MKIRILGICLVIWFVVYTLNRYSNWGVFDFFDFIGWWMVFGIINAIAITHFFKETFPGKPLDYKNKKHIMIFAGFGFIGTIAIFIAGNHFWDIKEEIKEESCTNKDHSIKEELYTNKDHCIEVEYINMDCHFGTTKDVFDVSTGKHLINPTIGLKVQFQYKPKHSAIGKLVRLCYPGTGYDSWAIDSDCGFHYIKQINGFWQTLEKENQ